MKLFKPKPTVSIKEFRISPDDSGHASIFIAGRASGLTGFILSLLRSGTKTELRIDHRWAVYGSSSIGSYSNTEIPIRQIKSISHGTSSRLYGLILCAVIAFLTLLGSVADGFAYGMLGVVVGALILIIGLLHFRASRRLFISLDSGGTTIELYAKKSKVGGAPVTANSFKDAAEAIKSLCP